MSDGYRTIRFLTDEDFSIQVVAEARRKEPGIDLLTAREVGLLHLADPLVLAYAAQHDRVLLTNDVHTMPRHFADFLASGYHSPGVLLIAQTLPIGRSVDAILLVWGASGPDEWRDLCVYPPH